MIELCFTLGVVMTVYSVKRLFIKDRIISDDELEVGYECNTSKSIIVSMRKVPHVLICGLSNTGKSRLVEYAVRNKNVVLVNVFAEDFKSLKVRRINRLDKIKGYLRSILEKPYKRDIPLFIVIDELYVLCMDKEVSQLITELLAIGRHYNIYLIGISQDGTKEVLKFKSLFNVRICFKMVEDSSYRAVLGYTPEELTLRNRQFYIYSDKVMKGCTYDV
jgi:hypothetical protein